MRPNLRAQRYTLAPGQDIPFQAGTCLAITGTSGNVSLNGSGMNDFPPGMLVPSGFKLQGPQMPDGSRVPIGLVFFRNESATASAYIEVWTSNGEVDLTGGVGASQVVRKTNVFQTTVGGYMIGATARIGLWIPGTSSKRIALSRWGYMGGSNGSTVTSQIYLCRASGISGGTDYTSATIKKRDPNLSNSSAVFKAGTLTLTAYDTVAAQVVTAGMTVSDLGWDKVVDLTNGGTVEPSYAPPGADSGFYLQGSVDILGAAFFFEWTEE